jgi:hypothetical protein
METVHYHCTVKWRLYTNSISLTLDGVSAVWPDKNLLDEMPISSNEEASCIDFITSCLIKLYKERNHKGEKTLHSKSSLYLGEQIREKNHLPRIILGNIFSLQQCRNFRTIYGGKEPSRNGVIEPVRFLGIDSGLL